MQVDFNNAINSKLKPILETYSIALVEEHNNFALFKSNNYVVRVAYNNYDYTGLLCINENVITNKLINAVFNSDIKVEEVTKSDFINNVILFIEQFGKLIFNGEELVYQIQQQSFKAAEEYTKKILIEQKLKIVNEA
jgi:hypothetical protein